MQVFKRVSVFQRIIVIVLYLMTVMSFRASAQQSATLNATPSFYKVTLNWSMSSLPSNYFVQWTRLYRGTGTAPYQPIGSYNPSSPYVDNAVGYGVSYWYVLTSLVRVVDPVAGTYDTYLYSNQVNTTPTSQEIAYLTPAKDPGKITLSWDTRPLPQGCTVKWNRLYRAVVGGSYEPLSSYNPTNPYVDTNVTSGTGYYYVLAYLIGPSDPTSGATDTYFYSSEAQIVASSTPRPATLTAVSDVSSVTLSWTPLSFTNMGVERKEVGTSDLAYAIISGPNTASSPYVDYSAEYGKTYCYRLGPLLEDRDLYRSFYSNEVIAGKTGTPPIIAITSPSANSTVSDLYNNISGTIYEQNGIQQCLVQVKRLSDGYYWDFQHDTTYDYPRPVWPRGNFVPWSNYYLTTSLVSTGPNTYSFSCTNGPNYTQMSDGYYQIIVQVLDGQNINSTKTITVFKGFIAPRT